MKYSNYCTLIILSFFFSTSWSYAGKGGSSGVGGGGDVLILPNDQVLLADFYIREIGTHAELPKQAVEELKRVRFIFDRYAGVGKFVDDQIFNPFIEYRLVPGIQMPCQRVELGEHPGERALGGCSTGMTTYLDKSFMPRLTIRQFAELVVHERLRGQFPNIDDSDLKEITIGLDTALDVLSAQLRESQRIGQLVEANPRSKVEWQLPSLTDQELRNLNQLRWRLYRLFKRDQAAEMNAWTIHRNGGGLIDVTSRPLISDSITVTLSSRLALNHCKIGAGTVLHNQTLLCPESPEIGGYFEIGERCYISGSRFYSKISSIENALRPVIVGNRGKVIGNSFSDTRLIAAQDAVVIDSGFSFGDVHVNESAVLQESSNGHSGFIYLANNSQMKQFRGSSWIDGAHVVVGPSATIENVVYGSSGAGVALFVGQNSRVIGLQNNEGSSSFEWTSISRNRRTSRLERTQSRDRDTQRPIPPGVFELLKARNKNILHIRPDIRFDARTSKCQSLSLQVSGYRAISTEQDLIGACSRGTEIQK